MAVHLEDMFFAQLDIHSSQLIRVIRAKGGSTHQKNADIMDILDQVHLEQASPNGGPRSGSGPSDGPIRTHDQFKIIIKKYIYIILSCIVKLFFFMISLYKA